MTIAPLGLSSDEAVAVTSEGVGRRRRSRGASGGGARALQERALVGLLTAVIVGSVLAVGSVHSGVLVVVAVVALLAGGLALAADTREGRTVPVPATVAVLLAGYTLIQAVPLPQAVVWALSPPTAEIWEGSLALTDSGEGSWISVSLNPTASLVESLKWLLYASVFLAAARVGRLHGSSLIPTVVFGAAVICAVLAIAHRLASAERLYGIYEPVFAHPRFALAPLLNSNNFAGYLNLGLFAGLGLLFTRSSSFPRWAIALAISLVIGLSAALGSRGGTVALLCGLIVLPAFLWRRRRHADSGVSWRSAAMFGSAVAGGLLLFGLAATRDLWQALLGEGAHKLALFSWTRPLIAEHFFFGVGRGAFETAFPAYRGDSAHHVYSFAENFVLQWSSEWGVPVALAALLVFGWTLRPSRLAVRQAELGICCVVGAGVLLAHNLLDLALEVPAVSIAFFALLGGLFGANQRTSGTEANTALPVIKSSSLRAPIAALATACVGIVLATLIWGRPTVVQKRSEIGDLLKQHGRELLVLDQLKTAIRRYPADPYFPLVGSVIAFRMKENPLPWLARAIERDPMSGRPYLLLAYALAGKGAREQAVMALRMAAERDAPFRPRTAALALALGRASGDVLRVVPIGKRGASLLTTMAIRVDRNAEPELRRQLLEEALVRDRGNARAALERSKDLLMYLESGSYECALSKRPSCIDSIDALMDGLAAAFPHDGRPTIIRARLRLLTGRPAESLRMLTVECGKPEASLDCLAWQVRAAEVVGERELAEASAAYLARACSTPKACESGGAWLGSRHLRRGDSGAALRVYERVAREADSPGSWRRVAIAAAKSGFAGLATQALERFRASGGKVDAELAQQVAKVRAGVLNSLNPLETGPNLGSHDASSKK